MSTTTVPDHAEGWAVPGYVEQRELGHGASGRVVEAVQERTTLQVAIRYLSPDLVADPDFLPRFRTQMLKLKELDVPSVVRVYDYAEQPGQGAAVVMELVDGVSLRSVIEGQGPLEPVAALAVLKGSLLGLAAVHRLGFGHRDVTPGNVLVDTSGQVKLTGFGMAALAAEEMQAVGTPSYLAPERWEGDSASPASDVYAATAVFFECLTGEPPFSGDLAALQEQHVSGALPLDRVDARLAPLIAQGMAKDPASRPHSANAFISELEALAGVTYGSDWEKRGRALLAARAATARAAAARAAAPRPLSRGRRQDPSGGSPAAAASGGAPPTSARDRVDRGRRCHRAGGHRHRGHDVRRGAESESDRIGGRGDAGPADVLRGGQRDASGGGGHVRHGDRLHLQRDDLGRRARNGELPVGVLLGRTGPGADRELLRAR